MRYKVFLLISISLFACGIKTSGCWHYSYSAGEYYMYRPFVGNPSSKNQGFNFGSDENCLLWQSQTTREASVEEIYVVVYKSSLEQLRRMAHSSGDNQDNHFLNWLAGDKEALDFLLLAKECETIRSMMASPWYYPSKANAEKRALESIVEKALSYSGKRFQARYVLQAVRALHTLARHDECIRLWETVKNELPDNIIKRMTMNYIGGSYSHLGDRAKAREFFDITGDVLRNQVAAEVKKSERLQENLDICLRMAKGRDNGHLDFWYYTAAYIKHLLGEDREASLLLSTAEKLSSEKCLSESIRVFRIYLDAVLTPFSSSYEAEMVKRLSWLDERIVEHHEEAEEIMKEGGIYRMKSNISFFYWNDMMRKIVLGVICPKLVKHKRGASAIAFANMADNRLLTLVGRPGHVDSFNFNVYDYSNASFALMDSLETDDLIRFEAMLSHPQNQTERFLVERGNTDLAYFRDIIGTKLLREMRYKEAGRFLEKVPASFQKRLNTYRGGYFSYDPFSVTRKGISGHLDYKYAFAKEMARLEEEMTRQKDPNRKALAQFRMATGMKNSVSSCWALTFYGKSCLDDDPEYGMTPLLQAQERLFGKAETLYRQAFSLADDPEVLAQMHYELKNLKTIQDKYPSSRAWARLKGKCDTYSDYHMEEKENFTSNRW